jgi:hypothetical protein
MKNHVKAHFAGAIETLMAEFIRLQKRIPNLPEDEKQRQEVIVRAIALLSGELPVFAHLFSFSADMNISLHPTEELAIRDVKSIWRKNEFDPREDGSIIIEARLNGETGEGKWTLTDEGRLISNHGDELIGFSIHSPIDVVDLATASEGGSIGDIDWSRYELTAQVVATRELTVNGECTQIDWSSIEEIASTTLIIVRDVHHDVVFDVDVKGMDDENIISEVVLAIKQHEQDYGRVSIFVDYEDLTIDTKYEFRFMGSDYVGILVNARDGLLEFANVQDAHNSARAQDITAEYSHFSNVRITDLD